MGALDELLAKWRENPDSGTTLALCTYLGTSRREDLIREVGSTAEAWHKDDAQVLLAIGRMYLDAALLQEAQTVLVSAGKLNQTDPSPYRYLGEVLLRRGDASRAEKVLARALQMGATEPDTRMWHDRSTVYVALQARVGMRAVADEIERTVPKKNSIPPPTMTSDEADRLAGPRRGKAQPPPKPMPSVPPPPKLVSSMPPPPDKGLPSFRGEAISEAEIQTGRFSFGERREQPSRGELETVIMPAGALPSASRSAPPPARPNGSRREAPKMAAPPVPALYVPPTAPPSSGPRAPSRAPQPPPRKLQESPSGMFDDSPRPRPETVLDHLARVGVYERGGGAPPAWVAPPRDRPKGAWLFVVAIVLAGGMGYGGFTYAHRVRAQRAVLARSIEGEVKKLLETGKIEDLQKTDDKLSRVFDLDSRSQTAAILWLRNRVLSALMLPAEPRGIESAVARCKTLEIDDSKTAFGKITSFLAEGDLAGAAALLPKWDEKAKADPFYHLAAAALLERAGEVRAVGRYQQAFDLDPDLVIARVFHAELVTLELGAAAGRPLVDDVAKRLGDGPMARALIGLVWAVDPSSSDLPEGSRLAEADRKNLPTQLLAIPFVVEARIAARAGHTDDAIAALGSAIRVTATPAMATGIGQVAIDLGDEALARQATLKALSYSALYPRARSLAARVALLGARLDEAKNAIQELDSKSPEVAVVRAAAAYESLDLSELDNATAALGPSEGVARALSVGMGIAMGRKYPDAKSLEAMSDPSVPWGDLIAVDAALDTGNIELAQKIAGRWGDRASTPTYALRLARLRRYEGKDDDAAKASAEALVPGGVTPRVLVERFMTLLGTKDISGARDLIGQYPAVLGPMTDLLKVSADAADNKVPRAKALAARLEVPPDDSPLLYYVIAAKAFVDVGDHRGKDLVGKLLRGVPRDPDVVALARAVGFAR